LRKLATDNEQQFWEKDPRRNNWLSEQSNGLNFKTSKDPKVRVVSGKIIIIIITVTIRLEHVSPCIRDLVKVLSRNL
jgi:hypothetical protein